MIRKDSVIIRQMELSDVGGGLRLSVEQGWNQTEKDWELIIEGSQNVCLLAEYDGKIVGTTTAMNYSNEVAWIGMVLVDKEYRGQGISKLLLAEIFEKLSFSKSIKLDATPEGRIVYRKFGFEDEYEIARMTRVPPKDLLSGNPEPATVDDEVDDQVDNRGENKIDYKILPIQAEHIPEIIAFDHAVFGTGRQQLIESLVREYPGRSWMVMRDHSVAAFALGRKGINYQQIGPVMASTLEDAKALIAKALDGFENEPIVVDVLFDKEVLIRWLRSIGFVQQRHFIRMYRVNNPFPGLADKQHLICGPEFG